MKDVDVRDTRNFALIGHSHDGKTSLGEAILLSAGATQSLGKLEDGSSNLSLLPEEKERLTTMTSSVYAFDADGKHVTLVDTPGDPNFQPDAHIALGALDSAILVVSAEDGAKVGTERMWTQARNHSLAVLAFVNGMDKERADFLAAVDSLRKLEANPIPLALPIGAGENFKGVVDLLNMRARTAAGDAEIPADMADEATAARQHLIEAVAECDDDLLEKYLEEGELSPEEIRSGLVAGVRESKLVPVLCGVANTGLGADLLLEFALELFPSPQDRPAWAARAADGDAESELTADPNGPFAAVVFKTIIDRFAGKLSVFRVISGTATGDSSVQNATTGSKERFGKLFVLRGAEHVDVPEAGPGDIVAVAKLKDAHTGNVLIPEKGGPRVAELAIPEGVLSYAIEAKARGDEEKVFSSLARLVEEDPTLGLGREASTGEFLLTGMGELHIRTTIQKLRRLFELEVDLSTPKVPYRETVTRKAENVEGKLKKQTGGKGMFGVCYLTVEPLPRGTGFEFVDEIVGGSIPRGLIPAVEKGIREALDRGPQAGFPVVDVRVRCIDGKHHAVDSNEMAFKLAASFGFKAAVEQARPTILEPIMNVEVSAPEQYVGDIMGDLSSRRGRVQASEARGSGHRIQAQVPMAEMLEYASSLTSITAGQGAFHMGFSHYEEVPSQIQEKIVAEAQASRTETS